MSAVTDWRVELAAARQPTTPEQEAWDRGWQERYDRFRRGGKSPFDAIHIADNLTENQSGERPERARLRVRAGGVVMSAEEWDTRRDAIALDLLDQSGEGQDDPGVQYAALLLATRETSELLGDRPQDTKEQTR